MKNPAKDPAKAPTKDTKSWFRHAFAVDPPGPATPTADQQPAVDYVCIQVARRRLTTPGLIGLEMSRPLNWLGAQCLHFVRPGVWAITTPRFHDQYVHFSEFLERRGSIDYLGQRIEEFEAELTRIEKEGGDTKAYTARYMSPPKTTRKDDDD